MENDKLYDCAAAYIQNSEYEYEIKLYNSGTISKASFILNKSHFMHLSGLEKLSDIINSSEINSAELLDKILNRDITYQNILESSLWGEVFNDPQKNGVTYTLDDRIDTLTKFRDILNNSRIKAYSWDSQCHRTHRPYSSEIAADFMLVFETENKKTSDERIYAFFKLDKNNSEIAHGMSQFPTDRTYNNDGRRSVPEITIISLIEHDKVNNVDRVIFELPAAEQQRLSEKSLKNSEYATIKADLKQLKSKRTKYLEANTTAAQKAYEKRLSVFSNKNIYNVEMLKSVVERLTSQAQDPNNKQAKNFILREIEIIQAELANRERTPNNEIPSGITIAKSVRHDNGTVSMTKPIVTIETPQAVIKAKSQIEKGTHLADSSIRNIFTDIKDSFKKAISKLNKKTPERKPSKGKSVKPKSRVVQSFKPKTSVQMPVKEQKYEEEKVPMFSVSELQSDKYAPTSNQDKDICKNKKNDLDL